MQETKTQPENVYINHSRKNQSNGASSIDAIPIERVNSAALGNANISVYFKTPIQCAPLPELIWGYDTISLLSSSSTDRAKNFLLSPLLPTIFTRSPSLNGQFQSNPSTWISPSRNSTLVTGSAISSADIIAIPAAWPLSPSAAAMAPVAAIPDGSLSRQNTFSTTCLTRRSEMMPVWISSGPFSGETSASIFISVSSKRIH